MTDEQVTLSDDEARRAVLAIMAPPEWDEVEVRRSSAFWLVSGFYHGRFHGGTRADPVSLATSLNEIAQTEHAPPVVIVDEPTPPPPRFVDVPEPTNPNVIPDALSSFADADESAVEFRDRVKKLWQRFGISDGQHFPGGGEALTSEEKILMREIDMANQRAGNWLSV